jgi:hypothetical protein
MSARPALVVAIASLTTLVWLVPSAHPHTRAKRNGIPATATEPPRPAPDLFGRDPRDLILYDRVTPSPADTMRLIRERLELNAAS